MQNNVLNKTSQNLLRRKRRFRSGLTRILTGGFAHGEEFSDEEYEEAAIDDWPPGKAPHRHRSSILDRAARKARLDSDTEQLQNAKCRGIDGHPFFGDGRSNARKLAPEHSRKLGASDLHGGAHSQMPSNSRPFQSRLRNRNAARPPKHSQSTVDTEVRHQFWHSHCALCTAGFWGTTMGTSEMESRALAMLQDGLAALGDEDGELAPRRIFVLVAKALTKSDTAGRVILPRVSVESNLSFLMGYRCLAPQNLVHLMAPTFPTYLCNGYMVQ